MIISDENECITYQPCDANATCENNVGSFRCTCKNGYVGDGLAGTCEGTARQFYALYFIYNYI